jgi:hypothetical protein
MSLRRTKVAVRAVRLEAQAHSRQGCAARYAGYIAAPRRTRRQGCDFAAPKRTSNCMRSRIRLGAIPPITTWSIPDCGASCWGISKDRGVPCHVLVAGSRFEFACCSQARCCLWLPCPALARAHIAPAHPPHALRDMPWPPRALRSGGRAARSHRLRGRRSASPRHAATSVEGPASIERPASRVPPRGRRRAGPSRASLRSGRARRRPRRNPQVARARPRADQPPRANRPR